MSALRAWKWLRRPVSDEKRRLLRRRWQELPPSLQVGWQVVGQQMAHCGFTLGASYCSFGCTHCYLPPNANRAPLPTLLEMKQQIDANRRSLGELGALQITGGDVLDAYWRGGRPEELVEILRYAHSSGLVPMLMTHGQLLLDQPDYFERLVEIGGLRRLAVHIDSTQAGRPGFPLRAIESEADLHPLRDRFVEALSSVRERTGRRLHAALTVTVTQSNLDSLPEIVEWLRRDPRNARAFRMLSLQTEAAVGRTRMSRQPVTPDQVWLRLGEAFGLELPEGSFWFGDPDCSRMVSLALEFPRKGDGLARVHELIGDDPGSRRFLTELLATFGGVGSRPDDRWEALARRGGLLVRRPRFLAEALRYALERSKSSNLDWRFLRSLIRGRVVGLSLVQHNFMDREELLRGGPAVERRLAACSFRGAVKRDEEWVDVPMCSLNGEERERLYDQQILQSAPAPARRFVPLPVVRP